MHVEIFVQSSEHDTAIKVLLENFLPDGKTSTSRKYSPFKEDFHAMGPMEICRKGETNLDAQGYGGVADEYTHKLWMEIRGINPDAVVKVTLTPKPRPLQYDFALGDYKDILARCQMCLLPDKSCTPEELKKLAHSVTGFTGDRLDAVYAKLECDITQIIYPEPPVVAH